MHTSKTIILFAIFLSMFSFAECLKDGQDVTFAGTVSRETFPGPPNYESIDDGDTPETYWILTISTPQCVTDESMESGALYEVAKSTKRFQLVFEDASIYKTQKNLVENGAVVEGQLFTGTSGHHHTKALISVKSIKPVVMVPGSNVPVKTLEAENDELMVKDNDTAISSHNKTFFTGSENEDPMPMNMGVIKEFNRNFKEKSDQALESMNMLASKEEKSDQLIEVNKNVIEDMGYNFDKTFRIAMEGTRGEMYTLYVVLPVMSTIDNTEKQLKHMYEKGYISEETYNILKEKRVNKR